MQIWQLLSPSVNKRSGSSDYPVRPSTLSSHRLRNPQPGPLSSLQFSEWSLWLSGRHLWLKMGAVTPPNSSHLSALCQKPRQPTCRPPSFTGWFLPLSFSQVRRSLAPVHAEKTPFRAMFSVTLILFRVPSAVWYTIHSTKACAIQEKMILTRLNLSSRT